MALFTPYNSKASTSSSLTCTTEFEVLKGSHQFLRKDDEVEESQLSWDERLAKKYYSSLYREYSVCDLKHYKSGNFALRWRTEEEVLSGAGETTCGNTRCPLHREFLDASEDVRPVLTTLELPFSYTERGESKFALVKVVMCAKCCKKIMWKRNKEKDEQKEREGGEAGDVIEEASVGGVRKRRSSPISQDEDRSNGRNEQESKRSRPNENVEGGDLKRKRGSQLNSPRPRAEERRRH